jgi:hypothetical protein
MKHLLFFLAALLLTACADPSRNLYDGIKGNNDAKRTPNERSAAPSPSYDEYKKERDSQPAR